MSDSAVRRAPAGVRAPSFRRTPHARAWDRARFIVIAGWLALAIVVPFTADKASGWGYLRDSVATGKVTSVEINGEMPAGSSGFSTVELRWKRGAIHYVTYVRQVQGRQDADAAGSSDDDVSATLHSAPSARLASLQPGLRTFGSEHANYSGDKVLGFEAPGLVWAAAAVLMLASFVLLVRGPEVWRATRWAWFWFFSTPFGVFAFLLLAGPTPALPHPRSVERRLTGGWAFLLSCVLTISIGPIKLT